MARPTFPPRGIISARSLIDDSIQETKLGADIVGPTAIRDAGVVGPALGSDSVGLTALALVAERRVQTVTLGITPSTGLEHVVFRAPACGATIKAAYFCPGSAQNHAVNEADTWCITLFNKTTGLRLAAKNNSLSGVTLAATAYKTLTLNAGHCTFLSGQMMSVSLGISGSPAALDAPNFVMEWVPYTHA